MKKKLKNYYVKEGEQRKPINFVRGIIQKFSTSFKHFKTLVRLLKNNLIWMRPLIICQKHYDGVSC